MARLIARLLEPWVLRGGAAMLDDLFERGWQ